MNKFNKLAFTLAEVLIVLAVIGVVAAITIPNLADSYEEEKTVMQITKAYNEIDTACQKALMKYGDYSTWPKTANTTYERVTEFLQGRSCGVDGGTTSACFPPIGGSISSSGYKMDLSDGTLLALYQPNASSTDLIAYVATGLKSTTVGRNIFAFNITLGDGVYPAGYNSDKNTSNSAYTAGSNSYNVTNWVVHKKNMDYLKCASSLNWKTKSSCN